LLAITTPRDLDIGERTSRIKTDLPPEDSIIATLPGFMKNRVWPDLVGQSVGLGIASCAGRFGNPSRFRLRIPGGAYGSPQEVRWSNPFPCANFRLARSL